jgi:ribonuclease HII
MKDVSAKLLEFDNIFHRKGITYLCGVDEAGRGPLAGPVVAAAVIFPGDALITGINDSKKLTAAQREKLFEAIKQKAVSFSYSIADEKEIDEYNILGASLRAMSRSVDKLNPAAEFILIDGNKKFQTSIPCEAVVKGDGKSLCVAAASIVAKVVRDRLMDELDKEYPVYQWAQNKGYPTKEHIQAVLKYGACPYHRQTFLKNKDKWEKNDFYNEKAGG